MKCLLTTLFLLATIFSSTRESNSYKYRISFAVKVGIMPNGSLTQFAISYYKSNTLVSFQPVQRLQIEKIGSGEWPVPNSNTFFDYFEAYKVPSDTFPDGTILDYRSALDSLWKIRFQHHPTDFKAGFGWSNGEIRPSLKQQAYIYDRYGVRGYDQDYFSDTAFFQLLKDVIDPEWIANYKSLN